MKKKLFLVLAVLVFAVVISGCTKATTTSNTNTQSATNTNTNSATNTTNTTNTVQASTVAISNFAFNPATLTVKAGTAVTWTNNDSATHTVVSSAFNSGSLATGQSFSFTFSTPGTYQYSCSIHPSMQGTITVQ